MMNHFLPPGVARFSRSLALVLGTAALVGGPANALTLKIFDKSLPEGISVTGSHYEVDEETGRAMIAVELVDDSFEGRFFDETVAVPGLSFDRKSGEVLYQTGGSAVACAVRRKVLWATTYQPTPACRLDIRKQVPLKNPHRSVQPPTEAVVELTVREATRVSSR